MSGIHHHLVGDSPPMKDLIGLIEKAARSDATVLIRGESGTGKELVAQAIHANSARSRGRFVALNCAALTESLVESELYGHEKGAFTGAATQRKGEFELASGGTLFLDEVGELTPAIQSKLLRALQEREFKRVGGSGTIQVSIRIIAATNRNLETDFRKDLYYRLSVLPIFTPALRDRREDIPVLARRFATIFGAQSGRLIRGVSSEVERMLHCYDWPGNVRELQNAMEFAVTMGSGEFVVPEDLSRFPLEKPPGPGMDLPPAPAPLNLQANVEATKRAVVERAFAAAHGRHKDAASLLGLKPKYVYALLKKLKMSHLIKNRKSM